MLIHSSSVLYGSTVLASSSTLLELYDFYTVKYSCFTIPSNGDILDVLCFILNTFPPNSTLSDIFWILHWICRKE